jgi:hypothetical protein
MNKCHEAYLFYQFIEDGMQLHLHGVLNKIGTLFFLTNPPAWQVMKAVVLK